MAQPATFAERDEARALPRASMIVIAFNQERYIEEAIAGAFAQDYPNLQIVLSDDNSSDQTHAIMLRAQAAYEGPHDVVVNRTPGGAGVLQHVYAALAHCDGDLIVGAAGDDVSLPRRVTTLIEAWQTSNADALFSDFSVIDDDGNLIENEAYVANAALKTFFPGRGALNVFGATTAYNRRVFERIAVPSEPILFEDLFLSLMIHLHGGEVIFIPEKLIFYRKHDKSLTNSHGSSISVMEAELKGKRLGRDFSAVLHRFRLKAENALLEKQPIVDIDMDAVKSVERFYEYSAIWTDVSFTERLKLLASLRSLKHLRWAGPRLFGLSTFIRLKDLQRSFRRGR